MVDYFLFLIVFVAIVFALYAATWLYDRVGLWLYGYRSLDDIDIMSGSEFEQWVAKQEQAKGYRVTNIQDSYDFGVDVISVRRHNLKVAIQCKRYSSNVGIAAVQQVFAAKAYYDCDRAEVWTNAGFTRSAITLADKLNVTLIGRDTLNRTA